jgi:hypothetical protein
MMVRHIEIGICGLSCRLCPRYHTDGVSRCGGCKSDSRLAVRRNQFFAQHRSISYG